jgi:hypothetical protein
MSTNTVFRVGDQNIDVRALVVRAMNGEPPPGTPSFAINGQQIDIDSLIAAQVAGGGKPAVGTPSFAINGVQIDIDSIIAETIVAETPTGEAEDPIPITLDAAQSTYRLLYPAIAHATLEDDPGGYTGRFFKFTLTEQTGLRIRATYGGSGFFWPYMVLFKGETYATRDTEWLPPPGTTYSIDFDDAYGGTEINDSGTTLEVNLEAGTYLVELSPSTEEDWQPEDEITFYVVTDNDVPQIEWQTITKTYTQAQLAARGATSTWADAAGAVVMPGDAVSYRITLSGTPFTGPAVPVYAKVLASFVTEFTESEINTPGWDGTPIAKGIGGTTAPNRQVDFRVPGGLFNQVTGGGPITFSILYYVPPAA